MTSKNGASVPAVLLNTSFPNSLGVIRSLGRRGVPIVAVDRQLGMAMYSRYVRRRIIVPRDVLNRIPSGAPFLPRERLPADWLLGQLESLELPAGSAIIPTTDVTLHFAASHHERLSKRFSVACPPWEQLQTLWDRQSCWKLAQHLGIAVPKSYNPASIQEFEDLVAGLDFEERSWMIRVDPWSSEPISDSGNLTRPGGNSATLLLHCREHWQKLGRIPEIVEIIPGPSESCIAVTMVIAPDGTPLGSYSTRRLEVLPYYESRARDEFHPGGNVFCETRRDQEAIDCAHRLVREAGFYGAATIEFRRRWTDDRLFLIKVDPHPVNSNALSGVIGQDQAEALYELLTGVTLRRPAKYPDGVAWIWIRAYLHAILRWRLRMPIHRQAASLIRRVPNIKAYGDASLHDPKPFLVTVWSGIKSMLGLGAID